MAKVYVLDTETKGTGANVVPLEKVVRPPADREPAERKAKPARSAKRPDREAGRREGAAAPARPAPRKPVRRTATALPPGHVRKKATGELGKVLAVDPRAGTVTVRWLRSGASSTVPLSSVARR
jgi:hypothetical protein